MSCRRAARRPSRGGADPQLLHRLLPPADQGEHLRSRKLQPHRAAELLCRQAGQHQAGDPGAALRAEAAAEIRRDHPHARNVEAKTLRQRGAVGEHRLRRRVHGEVAAVPVGQHHLRLDGQVVVRRRGVAPLERHRGRGQRRLRLAAPAVGGGEPGGARRESRLARLLQRRDGRRGRIAHLDHRGRGARRFRRLRQHQGDRLAGEMHDRLLAQGEERRRRDPVAHSRASGLRRSRRAHGPARCRCRAPGRSAAAPSPARRATCRTRGSRPRSAPRRSPSARLRSAGRAIFDHGHQLSPRAKRGAFRRQERSLAALGMTGGLCQAFVSPPAPAARCGAAVRS